ncbi:MAG: hypothetical protein M1836_006939 [Candelina mexicana]|nr:MAG: hypothetical protein M1836_006939 [Candelina mexicana]
MIRNLRSSMLHIYFLVIAQVNFATAKAGFHLIDCYKEVAQKLKSNDSSTTPNPALFFSANPTNPILTYDGCQKLCGSGTGWYPDAIPRLITWLLPVMLLVSNMMYAPIGKQRFFLIVHLLGNPVGSTRSLLAKADGRSRCFSHAQRLLENDLEVKSLAVISAAAEEVSYDLDYALILNQQSKGRELIVETAFTLIGNRRSEVLRTLLAITIYVFGVLAAFIPAVGASASPSGGRIATAMLLSWLIPVILLSNVIGDMGSPRNCRRIIAELMCRLSQQPARNLSVRRTANSHLKPAHMRKKLQEQNQIPRLWSDAMYCYSLKKASFQGLEWKLTIISVLPIAIAFGTAFAVLVSGSVYFSCRHILVVVVSVSWLSSATLTALLSWTSPRIKKRTWYIILIKDLLIGSTALSLIITSTCGLWNTCYCYSGALQYGKNTAQVPLNPTELFERNDSVRYPAMVATCLCLQICVFGLVLWLAWPGFRMMWWSEDEKVASDQSEFFQHSQDMGDRA